METVGQLEETARKLEDVTTKLENLAEKMEGIENEAKKEESLFNKILAKKTFGILGWGFFAFVIVSLIAQEIGVTLVRMLHSGGGQIPSIMTYIVSFFPLYLVAFPVLLLAVSVAAAVLSPLDACALSVPLCVHPIKDTAAVMAATAFHNIFFFIVLQI